MSSNEANRHPKVLLIWNGTVAGGGATVLGDIGGGDQVIIKCVNQGALNPDILLPRSASHLVPGARHRFLSASNIGGGLPGLIALLLMRTAQGVWRALRLRGAGYDVVVATSPFFFDLLPLFFSKAKRKGAIVYHIPPKRKATSIATRVRFALAAIETKISLILIRASCDFLILGNDHVGHQFESIAPGTPWSVLHAGIDTARIDKHPDQPRKSKHACFLGRLTSQKGIFDLLDVMERIANADADFHLTLMGNGPERAALASAIKSRKLSNITLKGFVTEEEKFAILKSSEFFLFPSYEEGWGIALAEALYSGCKVVTYELAHYRDIFREFPKYAPLGNSAEFANVVLSNIGPPASEEQRSFIRQYDDKNVVQQFDATLKRLVTESSART